MLFFPSLGASGPMPGPPVGNRPVAATTASDSSHAQKFDDGFGYGPPMRLVSVANFLPAPERPFGPQAAP